MCEEKHCHSKHGPLCSCTPIVHGDAFQVAVHLAENMTDVTWHLTYNTLEQISPYQLCLIGECRLCGGRLCIEQKPFGVISTDDFLAAAYRHLHQFHHNLAQPLSEKDFRARFLEMFRKEDQPFVETWLTRPENQSVYTMYRRNEKNAYTIVHIWADADQNVFSSLEGKGTYLSLQTARREMARLAEQEKCEMVIPFEPDLYREEYGDDFWEAYQDGYAAGWFTRYEIIESPICEEKETESCPI